VIQICDILNGNRTVAFSHKEQAKLENQP